MASPALNSSWIPHKSVGTGGEGGRKTEIHEYPLLLPKKLEKGNCSEPLSMPIPKLDKINMNASLSPALLKFARLSAVCAPIVCLSVDLLYFEEKCHGAVAAEILPLENHLDCVITRKTAPEQEDSKAKLTPVLWSWLLRKAREGTINRVSTNVVTNLSSGPIIQPRSPCQSSDVGETLCYSLCPMLHSSVLPSYVGSRL